MDRYPGASKEVRFILSGISLVVIICYLLWNKYYAPTYAESFLNDASMEAFNGKVDSIYNDVPNHNERVALLSSGYKFEFYPEWKSKIGLGDSLAKKSNSLKIEVYKKEGKRIDLDYKEIARGFRKDLQ